MRQGGGNKASKWLCGALLPAEVKPQRCMNNFCVITRKNLVTVYTYQLQIGDLCNQQFITNYDLVSVLSHQFKISKVT